MSSVVVEIPNSIQLRLDEIAERSGMSVADLLLEAADKMSQVEALERIKERARQRDTESAFRRVLAAVPDVPPSRPDDVIE